MILLAASTSAGVLGLSMSRAPIASAADPPQPGSGAYADAVFLAVAGAVATVTSNGGRTSVPDVTPPTVETLKDAARRSYLGMIEAVAPDSGAAETFSALPARGRCDHLVELLRDGGERGGDTGRANAVRLLVGLVAADVDPARLTAFDPDMELAA